MRDSKRQHILDCAVELFAMKGFRGTTTRDLAAKAGINEAIIFRHFKTKHDLYQAILEEKLVKSRPEPCAEMAALVAAGKDREVFEAIGRAFLERQDGDMTFMRLLLFSALEGHELSDMFLNTMAGRDPLAAYIERRMDQGAFRRLDPHLAARGFFGMFVSFVQWQEIFGLKKTKQFERAQVVETFVSIFMNGMAPSPDLTEGALHG